MEDVLLQEEVGDLHPEIDLLLPLEDLHQGEKEDDLHLPVVGNHFHLLEMLEISVAAAECRMTWCCPPD